MVTEASGPTLFSYLQVVNALEKGSVNPFKIIGIDSISVTNTVQNCSKDYTDCNRQTDIQVVTQRL